MSSVNNATTPVRQSSTSRGPQENVEISTSSPLSDPPPSSPPVVLAEMARKDNMPPPSQPASVVNRKRSHENVAAGTDERNSSLTVVESTAPHSKSADVHPDSSASSAFSAADLQCLQSQKVTQPMTPPDSTPPHVAKRASSHLATAVIQQPRSKAAGAKNREAAEHADKQKAEEAEEEEEEHPDNGSQASNESDCSAPADHIADFDWRDLEERYHAKMDQLRRQEQLLNDEWSALNETFEMWALAGNEHEVDRSFKRLKTQSFFVRHEENQLEQKREHYKKVVQAFQSALQLLGGD